MAVAVKNASEAPTHTMLDRLAVSSLVGVVYVLGCIGIVFYGIPAVWGLWGTGLASVAGAFVNVALMILLMLAAAGGLVYLGTRLVGPNPPHGLRAGVGIGIVSLVCIAFLTWGFGRMLEAGLGSESVIGAVLTVVLGLGLLYGFGRLFFRPAFEETLMAVEDQGWFSRTVYKGSQGQRVRRGTLIGILVLFGCGIFTLLNHHTLEAGDESWALRLPFTEKHTELSPYVDQITVQNLTILRDVRFTVPLLLALAGLWIAFRVVNFPVFADFLIATEAEMNKVSWTTRKRLWQDTVVVLATLVLLTVFLMVVDLFWGWALKEMRVLRIQDNQPTAVTQETDW